MLNESTFHHKQHTKSANSLRRCILQADIPKLTDVGQLSLHLPSFQIVGSLCHRNLSIPFQRTPLRILCPLRPPPMQLLSLLLRRYFPSRISPIVLRQSPDLPYMSHSSSSSITSSTSSITPVHPEFRPPSNPPIPPPSLV